MLIQTYMAHPGATKESDRYLGAERRLFQRARFRFNAGRSVEETSTSRRTGDFEGPLCSIAVALATVRAWARRACSTTA
eukprot:5081277-Pyramimonas_sp.AAC.1